MLLELYKQFQQQKKVSHAQTQIPISQIITHTHTHTKISNNAAGIISTIPTAKKSITHTQTKIPISQIITHTHKNKEQCC